MRIGLSPSTRRSFSRRATSSGCADPYPQPHLHSNSRELKCFDRAATATSLDDDQENPSMAVRSRLHAMGTTPAGTTTAVAFTVPAERTAIVRRWSFTNRSSASREMYVGVRRGGSNVTVHLGQSIPPDTTMGFADDNIVLDPGDALVFVSVTPAGATGNMHWYASGSLLEGAPV
jgi:hypothetical protein